MRLALLAATLLLLSASSIASAAGDDVDAKLKILRDLADAAENDQNMDGAASTAAAEPRSQGRSRPAAALNKVYSATSVRVPLSDFGRHWRKRAMPEAAAALRRVGSALSELDPQQQRGGSSGAGDSEALGSALAAITSSCDEYAGYLLFAGMEDGTHADWPRLLGALFSTLWSLAELSGRLSFLLQDEEAAAGLAAWMRPGDLRSIAKALVGVADDSERAGQLQPENVLLVRLHSLPSPSTPCPTVNPLVASSSAVCGFIIIRLPDRYLWYVSDDCAGAVQRMSQLL